MKPTPLNKLSLMALAALIPCVTQAANIDVIATQTVNNTSFGANVRAITTNTTWYKDNIYILKDKVFVTNGATLTIEPGTKIYSTLNTKGTTTKDDDAFGSIVITRGAKINAVGTASEPIVMTTIDELEAETQTDLDGDSSIAELPTVTTAGRWGGLVVLGSAPVANFSGTNNIGEDRIEGFQPAASVDLDADGRADVIEYGGANAADNSGTIRYVSIRHGGYVYSGSNEINGLTLGGVGSGTTINYVEVFANADDGIEFFGGTVNTNNIVLAFNQDDSFDIDQGYSGTNQFWFSIQAPKLADGVGSAHDNGGEWDGVTGAIADNASNSTPIIYNATFIGSGTAALDGNDKGNNAIFLDDRFKGKVYNSVFDDFKEDLIECTGDGLGTGAEFANNTIGRFGGGAYTGTNASNLTYLNSTSTAANTFFDANGAPINGNSNGGVDPQFKSYSRNSALELSTIDPRPASASPLLSVNGATLKSGAPATASYRGAFGPTDNWAAGWTKMDQVKFFTPKVDVIATQTVNNTSFGNNVRAITTNTTWTKDNVYILKDKVFVTNGATLTIEPGTKIYSTLNTKGTTTKDDDAFGSIVITRGAKINAVGTASEPIVMTTIDELEAETQTDLDGDSSIAELPTVTTAGRWGGLVVLGSAPVANFSGTNNIGEDRIEGFQPAASVDLDADGRADVIEYGGANAADNSGTIRYVSIRHGGYVYSGSNEINGLTLGGVGSGTTINYVEVFANADDGIEFFGGTVNTNNIVLAFNQDDSFDIDQGYSGTNQFWFSIQAPKLADGVGSAHDNGGEWDGVTGAIADNASNSTPIIYNATFIGSGTAALDGNDKGNNAIFLDDRFKGKVYNSVFDDFKEDLIECTGDGLGTGAEFANNTIGRFGGGAYTGTNASNLTYLNSTSTAASTFFDANGAPINGNSNGGVNPQFKSYKRDGDLNLLTIDPRPATGSPLLTGSRQSGAPVSAAFRGAFGSSDNWAAGWTKMSIDGFLLGEASSGSMADADGDGISDAVETANTALGFNAAANDATTVLGTLKTTAQFNANYTAGQTSVTSNPNSFSLYNTADILDLRTVGQTTVQAGASNVTLTVPVQKSTGLSTWESAGSMTLTIPKTADKEFYRLSVEGAN